VFFKDFLGEQHKFEGSPGRAWVHAWISLKHACVMSHCIAELLNCNLFKLFYYVVSFTPFLQLHVCYHERALKMIATKHFRWIDYRNLEKDNNKCQTVSCS